MVDANQGWKSLGELTKLSDKELRHEKTKRRIGLVLGPLLFLILAFLIPTPAGMSEKAQWVLAITVWVVVWWFFEPIPIPATSLVVFLLVPLMGIMEPNAALAYLGQSNSWLILGIFIFSTALIEQGVARRMALWLLSRDFAAKSPKHLIFIFTVSMAVVSAFMSHIASAMLFLVIAEGLVEAMGYDKGHPFMKTLKFATAYGSQTGGLLTPIGAANVNFITIGLCASLIGVNIRFVDFCAAGIPAGVVTTIIAGFFVLRVCRGGVEGDTKSAQTYAKQQLAEMGPMKRGEGIAVALFVLAVALWILPSLAAAIFGKNAAVTAALDRVLNATYVSMFVALLAFLIPIDRKTGKTLTNWTQAVKNVNWGVIFLVAGGLLLGGAMNAEGVGLIAWFAKQLSGVIGGAPQVLIVLAFILLEMVLTQFISNIPAISIVTTISVPVAMAAGVNPVALAFVICFSGQMSFALPVAAPQMAIIYGSGGIKIGEFIRNGVAFTVLTIPCMLVLVYYWVNLIFPYVPVG